MKKPVMKREVAIYFASKILKVVYLWATNDALPDLATFGDIAPAESAYPNGVVRLQVDGRYDFDEVIAYIEDYGK